VLENEEVIARQQHRVAIVQAEVERRGFRFEHEDEKRFDLIEEGEGQGDGMGMGGLVNGSGSLGTGTSGLLAEGMGSGGLGSRGSESGGVRMVMDTEHQDNFNARRVALFRGRDNTVVVENTVPAAEGMRESARAHDEDVAIVTLVQQSLSPSVSAQTEDDDGIYL